MKYFLTIFGLICVIVVSVLGLRGTKFTSEPLYIFPDMDWQDKYLPQSESPFFADGRTDRAPIPGTILRSKPGDVKGAFSEEITYMPAKNPKLFSGKNEDGSFITDFPIPVSHELMERGQQQFNTYCYLCHGASGDGNGVTKSFGMVATPTYHDARLRDMPIGEIFNTITNGKGQMLSYADKLSPEDRWAVVLYVRALQRTQNATIEDVPQTFRTQLEQ